jgi:hypothetical protein
VLVSDAVHPTHAARPAGRWAPKQEKLAIEQKSGRDRINGGLHENHRLLQFDENSIDRSPYVYMGR